MADALATLSSMIKVHWWNHVPHVAVNRLERPAYVFAAESVVIDEKPWYYDIKNFLKTQEYPEGASKNDKKTLRRLAGSFYLNQDDVLYKRNFDMVLLRCVDRHEADMLMQEVHEGSFGTHAGGHAPLDFNAVIAQRQQRQPGCDHRGGQLRRRRAVADHGGSLQEPHQSAGGHLQAESHP